MKPLIKYILSSFGGKAIRRNTIESACNSFAADPTNTVNFMISYGYLVRVLRGLYYVKTPEEFMLKKAVEIYRILSLGMDELMVNWYFGLYTALRLNGVTHEFSDTIFVLSDEIFRAKDVKVAGENVRFMKLSRNLFGFGVIEKNGVKFSDLEKTVLDMVYISKYRSTPEQRIASSIEVYANGVASKRLKEYLKSYPRTVAKVIKYAGLI